MNETISSYDDVVEMLDSLLREPTDFWNAFYEDRDKKIPFFVNKPDENLVSYFENQFMQPGNVLELGCGPGRNALYFAEKGCTVDAVDLSEESLRWAEERANEKEVSVNFIHKNIFELQLKEEAYDIIYDSGCFHHIAPHRRMSYLNLLSHSLKPGGYFAITCFVKGGELGGADITDWEVYRRRSLQGGLGFTEESLRTIFNRFEVVEIRRMKDFENDQQCFGTSALWTALFRKS
ncbi:class I SAM-dependent methyltransferase [Sporosarcina sp. OR05]|uniref:class I SAM-dependent methyltransferase n=1 Tax=Sporosarcina sp. OR05 TaxID=2969819 RepID=UPI00352BB920